MGTVIKLMFGQKPALKVQNNSIHRARDCNITLRYKILRKYNKFGIFRANPLRGICRKCPYPWTRQITRW